MYLAFFLHSKDSIFITSFVKMHPLHLHTFSLQVLMDIANLLKTWSLNYSPTWNRRQFDVDIMSIHRKRNIDELPRRFHVLFRWNFDGQNIDVVSTNFRWSNFDELEILVFSTYLIQCKFDVQKIDMLSTNFIQLNFDGRNFDVV